MRLTYLLIAAGAVCGVSLNVGCTNSDDQSNNDAEEPVVASQSEKPSAGSTKPAPKAKQRKPEAKQRKPKPRKTDVVAARPPSKSADQPKTTVATNPSVTTGKFEWPCWRGPNGNGLSGETGLIHSFPEDGPNIVWRAKLGTGYSGIAVAGGRAFTSFGEDDRAKAVCFDAANGEELWKIEIGKDFGGGRSPGPRAMPCVDGDRVYFVGAFGRLLCLNVDSGKEVWSMNLYEKFGMRQHEEGLSPTPLVDGKKLIVMAGKHVFALDKTSGQEIWKSLEERMQHCSPRLATINGRKQLLALTGHNLVGLSLEDGEEIWRHDDGGHVATPVVGPNNQIFIGRAYGGGNQVVRVDGDTARQVYKGNTMATHHATAVYYEGHLYGFHDRPGIFKCIDFATGEEKWVTRAVGKGKLIIADGQIILISESGRLLLAPVSSKEFEPTAKIRVLQGTCYTAPTLAGGKLYLRSNQEMVCIEMKGAK
ncbi:MAG: PQQ-binding-like beta-propeller repeat protein [Planctomycetes bacterium]|nr:PQQ-binding-like beta-propeller repeat protein [Planctomycetota bacterium]